MDGMRAIWLIVVGLGVAACDGPPLETVPVGSPGWADGTRWALRNQVDVLFVLDSSYGMQPKLVEVRRRFPELVTLLSQVAQSWRPLDLQIGVVTSDYGAGATGAPGCMPSPGGQQGRLQGIGAVADATCRRPVGANFIKYVFEADGAGASNLPPGQDLITTFQCMASVGDGGCGFAQTLEAARAALVKAGQTDPPDPDNAGFLREEALLLVVFVTDGDDGSAPPDTDVFDPDLVARYGYEDRYSRQTRFGVVCGAVPALPPDGDSNGPLAGCRVPRPTPAARDPGSCTTSRATSTSSRSRGAREA
jgi:hypothetical protein